jgi:outer membrane protein assembly factor BamD (BamD/ComL family)
LREEAQLLLGARGALRSGDCKGALEKLEETRTRFPNGALSQEREALAIEALACAGRDVEAADRAAAFLREYPASPHADAVGRHAREGATEN